MPRLDIERQKELEPKRIDFAKSQIEKLGLEITLITTTELRFIFKNSEIKFFPYSGWFSGKNVKDGRGIHNLIKQLKV